MTTMNKSVKLEVLLNLTSILQQTNEKETRKETIVKMIPISSASFFQACMKNCICTAQWLYCQDNSINVHYGDDYIFRSACRKGHLKLAKWLYQIGANIHAADDYAIRNSPKNITRWINTLL